MKYIREVHITCHMSNWSVGEVYLYNFSMHSSEETHAITHTKQSRSKDLEFKLN